MARAVLLRSAAIVLVGATLAVASASVAPKHAEAQVSTVHSLPKGTIGLGLVGVELGLIIPAAAGARDWWPYLVFPLIGGAGGAVGGYFLDVETNNQPEVGVTLFAVGVALLVPTIIGTLALTAYTPPEDAGQADTDMDYQPSSGDSVDATQDDAPAGSEAAPDGGSGDQARLEGRLRALTLGGPGLLRVYRGQLLLGVPVPTEVATYAAEELERLPLRQHHDVNIPIVSAMF